MSVKIETQPDQKPVSPLSGLGIAVGLLGIGLLLILSPRYLNASGVFALILLSGGILCLSFSTFGALHEGGKLLKTQGLYWVGEGLTSVGVALFFAVPAVALHLASLQDAIGAEWLVSVRCLALVLTAIAILGGSYGLFQMATKGSPPQVSGQQRSDDGAAQQLGTTGTRILTVVNAVLAVVSAVVNIFALIDLVQLRFEGS